MWVWACSCFGIIIENCLFYVGSKWNWVIYVTERLRLGNNRIMYPDVCKQRDDSTNKQTNKQTDRRYNVEIMFCMKWEGAEDQQC